MSKSSKANSKKRVGAGLKRAMINQGWDEFRHQLDDKLA
jgi:hypothetical protein